MTFRCDLEQRLSRLRPEKFTGYGLLYERTYSSILKYFREQVDVNNLSEDHAKIGAALCYAWMPTTQVRQDSFLRFNTFRTALKNATCEIIDESDLKELVAFIGGSLVATSKYLHFLCPSRYAIWDNRIARAGYGFVGHNSVANTSNYLTYLEDISDQEITWHKRFCQFFPDATDVRLKELVLFHLDLHEQHQ